MDAASSRRKGIIMVLGGASLWGASGVAVQYLFEAQHLDPTWLASVRMLVAGFIMLLFHYHGGGDVFSIWQNARYRKQLVIFGIFGMMATQYTYYLAINYGNAATATILQYLMPVIVLVYAVWKLKRRPDRTEVLAVLLAMFGTYLLITKGQWDKLAISEETLFWGVLSAFAMAFYTIQPKDLLLKYSSAIVIGWAMIIGGGILTLVRRPWPFIGIWDLHTFLALVAVVVFGTIIAFYTYLESTKYIKPSEVGALASVEPLSSVILSVLLLNVDFGIPDSIGVACILGTVFLLSKQK